MEIEHISIFQCFFLGAMLFLAYNPYYSFYALFACCCVLFMWWNCGECCFFVVVFVFYTNGCSLCRSNIVITLKLEHAPGVLASK